MSYFIRTVASNAVLIINRKFIPKKYQWMEKYNEKDSFIVRMGQLKHFFSGSLVPLLTVVAKSHDTREKEHKLRSFCLIFRLQREFDMS